MGRLCCFIADTGWSWRRARIPYIRSSRRGPMVRSWSGRTAGFLECDDRRSSGCLPTHSQLSRQSGIHGVSRIGPLRDDGRRSNVTRSAPRETKGTLRGVGVVPYDRRCTQGLHKAYLAQLAKEQGITGWHAMRKDQLIRALSRPAPLGRSQAEVGQPAERPAGPQGRAFCRGRPPPTAMATPCDPLLPARIPPHVGPRLPRTLDHAHQKDRIVVLTRDSRLATCLLGGRAGLRARAQAALGQDWHAARPILRLMDVSSEDTTWLPSGMSAIS